jgi:hypothetical protein
VRLNARLSKILKLARWLFIEIMYGYKPRWMINNMHKSTHKWKIRPIISKEKLEKCYPKDFMKGIGSEPYLDIEPKAQERDE